MSTRRTHGKRSIVARIAKARAAVIRSRERVIEREAQILLAHALLSLKMAKEFIVKAEHVTAKTL